MTAKQVESIIEKIIAENHEDARLLTASGFDLTQFVNNLETEDEDSEFVMEGVLSSLTDSELTELAQSSYESIYADLQKEGCSDLAEALFTILNEEG